METLGENRYRECGDESESVRRDGQELGDGGGVPEGVDNGWLSLVSGGTICIGGDIPKRGRKCKGADL